MNRIEIKILSQNWITGPDNEIDLCSHGKIQLIINGVCITNDKDDIDDWSVSTSVLKLLRCIDNNHISEKDYEVIMHCGQLMMLGCPVGIYWDLKHIGDKIIIENIRKVLTTDESKSIKYDDLTLEIEKKDFAIEVLKCAEQVKAFFKNEPKRVFETDDDIIEWENFWKEFNQIYYSGIKKYNNKSTSANGS